MLRITRNLTKLQPLTRSIHQSTPKTNPSPLLSSTPTQYSSMKVASLKDECRKRGLRLGGKKADLIERLCSNDFSTVSKRVTKTNKTTVLSPLPPTTPLKSVSPTLAQIRLITSTPPAMAQGDTSTIDFCKLPKTALPADAPRIKIPTSPDAYGEVARYGSHSITNDRGVAESVAEEELHSKEPQEIHYASGHQVRSFTGEHNSEGGEKEFSYNDKLVLGGIVASVGVWWALGIEGKPE